MAVGYKPAEDAGPRLLTQSAALPSIPQQSPENPLPGRSVRLTGPCLRRSLYSSTSESVTCPGHVRNPGVAVTQVFALLTVLAACGCSKSTPAASVNPSSGPAAAPVQAPAQTQGQTTPPA